MMNTFAGQRGPQDNRGRRDGARGRGRRARVFRARESGAGAVRVDREAPAALFEPGHASRGARSRGRRVHGPARGLDAARSPVGRREGALAHEAAWGIHAPKIRHAARAPRGPEVRPAAVGAGRVARAAHRLRIRRGLSQNISRGLRGLGLSRQRVNRERKVHAHPDDGVGVLHEENDVPAPVALRARSPRGSSFDESRRRRGRDVDIPRASRGDAAAKTRIFRGS